MSVLYVCHGHPTFAKGGGELAAWRLFEAFRYRPGFEGSGFLAAASSPDHLPAGSELLGWGPDEWLIHRSPNSFFHNTAVNLSSGGQLHQAIGERRFKIIHLHHYLHVGIDLVLALKRWFPEAKLLLTLHDYWGPCVYEGRLLRRSGELCEGPEPDACADCVGEDRRSDLAIRNLRLQRMIASIDHFISPSQFLKDRYVDWGLSSSQISVVENLPAERSGLAISRKIDFNHELVLGFFGQVNPWKGVGLLVEAVNIARSKYPQLCLEIHGFDSDDLNGAHSPHPEFAEHLQCLLASSSMDGVRLRGRYEPHQLSARMESVDLVVMGSTWYENAPMVIQEAFLHGRPVIAPRLGGMAEKVTDGYSGLLFQPGDAADLARLLQRICEEPEILPKLKQYVESKPLAGAYSFEEHKLIYSHLLDSSSNEIHQSNFIDDLGNHDLKQEVSKQPVNFYGSRRFIHLAVESNAKSFLLEGLDKVHNFYVKYDVCLSEVPSYSSLNIKALNHLVPRKDGSIVNIIFVMYDESEPNLGRLRDMLQGPLIENINNNKYRLVIDFSNESCSSEYASQIESILQGAGIRKFQGVCIVCQNRLLRDNKNMKIKVFMYDFFPLYLTKAKTLDENQYNQIEHIIQEESFASGKSKALIACLNATPKLHRVVALAEACEQGLVSLNKSLHRDDSRESYISFPSLPYSKRPNYTFERTRDEFKYFGFDHYLPWLEQFVKMLPLKIDAFSNEGNDLAWDVTLEPYLNSILSIVTESWVDPGHVRMTEKTFKCCYFGHPFVIIGTSCTLQVVEEFGFNTFRRLIDSDYDIQNDWRHRLSLSIASAKDFVFRTIQDKEFFDKVQSVRLENYRWGSMHFIDHYEQTVLSGLLKFMEGGD